MLALVSGRNQLDERRLAVAAGATGRARRVDADRVRAVTGFAIGGVPPFGHRTPLRCFVDRDLLRLRRGVGGGGHTPRRLRRRARRADPGGGRPGRRAPPGLSTPALRGSAERPTTIAAMSGPSPSGTPGPVDEAARAAATTSSTDGPAPTDTAAPPPAARFAAFAAIVVAGRVRRAHRLRGDDKSCAGDCQTAAGGVGLLAAVGAAIGVAVVAVLVLRAMGEWRATPEEVRRAAREKAHRKRQGPRRRPVAPPR